MKKRSLWLLPLAGALALTGCSGSTDDAPVADTQTAESPVAEAPAASDEAPVTAQAPPAESKSLDEAQLKAVVEKLVADESGASVVVGSDLSKPLAKAQKMAENMKIQPEECAELIVPQLAWDAKGINMAVGTLYGENLGESTIYTVSSYEDASKLEEVKKSMDRSQHPGCENLSMEMQGMKLSVSAENLEATSDAELTLATKSVSAMDGVTMPMGTIQVSGVVGPNVVSAVYSGDLKDESAKLEELTKMLNLAVAELKKVQ